MGTVRLVKSRDFKKYFLDNTYALTIRMVKPCYNTYALIIRVVNILITPIH